MDPLRVLYLIDGLGPGGAQRQLVTLARAADPARVRPEVAIYHQIEHFVPALQAADIPVHRLGTRGGRDAGLLPRTRRHIRDARYDIVHAFMTRPGLLARAATVGMERPRVVVSERSVSLGRSSELVALERIMAGRAAAMIVNADVVREHVEAHVPSWRGRITVVPNGLEWSAPTGEDRRAAGSFRSEALAGDADLLLVSVARLAEPKNPLVLLEALALLDTAARARLRVLWVGACRDRSFGDRVRARARELGLDDVLAFRDPVEDVRPVYLAADATLLTSSWEGFPNVVLESLAHGTPVVATAVGEVPRLIERGRTGWIIEPKDPAALATALREVIATTPGRLSEMGAAAAATVLDEFSAERLFERTYEVYERVLADAR